MTLRCAASGSPSPTLLWRREGERVWGNPDLSLTLRNIKASGRYTCIAFNQWGRIHSSAYVTVRGEIYLARGVTFSVLSVLPIPLTFTIVCPFSCLRGSFSLSVSPPSPSLLSYTSIPVLSPSPLSTFPCPYLLLV